MNISEGQAGLVPSSTVAPEKELRAELAQLRKLVTLGLGALLFFTLAVNAYIGYQLRGLLRDGQQIQQNLADYNNRDVRILTTLSSNLVIFARSNPDFQPIMAKHTWLFPPQPAPRR